MKDKLTEGRVPYLEQDSPSVYDKLTMGNTQQGLAVHGADWWLKIDRAIKIAEEFNLDVSIIANQAFLSSLILSLCKP